MLGLTWDQSDQVVLPVGTLYDPFVLRGLDAYVYAAYSGARFVVAGTPSGVTLAPEGGAHLSTITASVGLELPNTTRTATTPSIPGALRAAFDMSAPVVTVHDAPSPGLAWLGSALGVPSVPWGVDGFGQSGTVADLYAVHDLTSGSIVNAALAALALR